MNTKKIILLCIVISLHDIKLEGSVISNLINISEKSLEKTENREISESCEDRSLDTADKSESPPMQSLSRTIENILEGNPDEKIKETLELIKAKKELNTDQKYIAACTFHRYNNFPWLDIRLKNLLDLNKYGRKTCLYEQNTKTFSEFEQHVNQEFTMFEKYLSNYYPNINSDMSFAMTNQQEHEKIPKYEMHNIEQIIFFRTRTLQEVFGRQESFLNFDLRPWLYMKNNVANYNSSDPFSYYQTVDSSEVTPEEIKMHQSLFTKINDLTSSLLAIEPAARMQEINCNKILKEGIRLFTEEQDKFQKLHCAQNEIDLYFQSRETNNFFKFHYLTQKIILNLGLGTKESINTQSLKSNISLKDIETYFAKDSDLTSEEKKAYLTYFINIQYKLDPDGFLKKFKQYNNSHKNIDCREYTINEKLKFILHAYANKNLLIKKEDKGKTFHYEYNESFSKLLNSTCDLDNKTINILEEITRIPHNYEEAFAYLDYTCDFLSDAIKKNPHNIKKIMVHDNYFLLDIFEKKYSLSVERYLKKYGRKIAISNTQGIKYSNNRILSQGNCQNFNVDPENTFTTLEGNKLFTIEGAGGWGKTSKAQGFLLECMMGRLTGSTFTANLTIPQKFLTKKVFFFHADGSLIYMNGNRPQSGSQSTGIKISSLDELCDYILKSENNIVFGSLDEALSTIDVISTPKMILSKEAIKELMAREGLFIALIEHDEDKISALGCQKAIILPHEVHSTINPKFIIGEIYPHIINVEEENFNEIYNILNQKEFQAGVTESIYFVLNDGLKELRLTEEQEYKKHFTERNNQKYCSINYTIRASTNQFDSNANIILNSNNIIIKPIIGEIFYRGNYYIYKIDISIALENGKIKIIPLKKGFQIAPKNSLFIEGKKIKFMESDGDEIGKKALSLSEFPIVKSIVEESINNSRTAAIRKAVNDHHDLSQHDFLYKSIFNF